MRSPSSPIGRPHWRAAAPGDAAFGAFDAVTARFFLFTLKGYAYLNRRLTRMATAREALAQLARRYPTGEI